LFKGPSVLPEPMVVLINDYAFYDVSGSGQASEGRSRSADRAATTTSLRC
jgi:hypothetical protein